MDLNLAKKYVYYGMESNILNKGTFIKTFLFNICICIASILLYQNKIVFIVYSSLLLVNFLIIIILFKNWDLYKAFLLLSMDFFFTVNVLFSKNAIYAYNLESAYKFDLNGAAEGLMWRSITG